MYDLYKEYQLMCSGQDNRGSKGELQDLMQRIPVSDAGTR